MSAARILTDAGQVEIIRAHQKDDYYLANLRRRWNDVLQSLLGPRFWMQWSKELTLAADIAYFSLTTLSGSQTLGEEYVNILQVDPSKRVIPSAKRRLLLVLLHVCTPYLLEKLLDNLEKKLGRNEFRFLPHVNEVLLKLTRGLKKNLVIIHRCHLTVFYLYGVFYHIAKRVAGVHYIRVRNLGSRTPPDFKILGYISLAQLGFTFCQGLYSLLNDWNKAKPEKEALSGSEIPACSPINNTAPSANQIKCSLCLEKCRDTTLTTCGHLFCWACIHEWCSSQVLCPLCRQKILPQKLVLLQNYEKG